MLLGKILGGISFVLGLLMIIGFPSITKYQPEPMGKGGVFIGIILMAVGLYFLFT